MIILTGLLIIGVIIGSVYLTMYVVDKIEMKFNKSFDYLGSVCLVLIIECLIALQVLYNMKLID